MRGAPPLALTRVEPDDDYEDGDDDKEDEDGADENLAGSTEDHF